MKYVSDFDHSLVHLYDDQYTAYLTKRKYSEFKNAYFYIWKVRGSGMSISICYAVIYILEACILWQYCRNLFHRNIQNSRKRYSCFRLFCPVCRFFFDNYRLNLVMFFLVNLLCIFIIYQLKLLTALFHSLFITISMTLSELGIISILSYFGSNFYEERSYFRNLVILSVISKLLYFLILQCTSIYIKRRITRNFLSAKAPCF